MVKQERPKSAKRIVLISVVCALAVVFLFGWWYLRRDIPTRYSSANEHFKYGSIGNEWEIGLPYWIWKVLPRMFPEKLPGEGYTSLGFILDSGTEIPIGFSNRVVGIKRIGLNCAVCHTGTVRDSPDSKPRIILGMPANNLDLQAYFRFLVACAKDERFTARNVMAEISKIEDLAWFESVIYYFAVPLVKRRIIKNNKAYAFMESRPNWGPGRVDTFNPYKVYFNFEMDADQTIGTADLPSLWNQKDREGLWLHWDGDNNSVRERNISAAIAVGVTPETLDLDSIKRVEDWMWELPPPTYPYAVHPRVAAKGKIIYDRYCANCHAFGSTGIGQVIPLEKIGTDPHRVESFTGELAGKMNTLGTGYSWELSHYRKTTGYSSVPLDGLWARAPYLHNGSVPTLWDLLQPVAERPKVFYRGYDVYDREKVGFVSSGLGAEATGFKIDTAVPGNGNQGHLYGTDLSPKEKKALLEYLKLL